YYCFSVIFPSHLQSTLFPYTTLFRSPLIDIGTHALDLTLWMMDNYQTKYVVGNTYRKLADTENAANAFGSWDPKEFNVEDSAFGYIVMENGASIYLESSWALNTVKSGEAKTTLHGTKGGADMNDGLTINGEDHGLLFDKQVIVDPGAVDFFEGDADDLEVLVAKKWIQANIIDKYTCVKSLINIIDNIDRYEYSEEIADDHEKL